MRPVPLGDQGRNTCEPLGLACGWGSLTPVFKEAYPGFYSPEFSVILKAAFILAPKKLQGKNFKVNFSL